MLLALSTSSTEAKSALLTSSEHYDLRMRRMTTRVGTKYNEVGAPVIGVKS